MLLNVGDIIEDNDPRMPHRRLLIVGFEHAGSDPYEVRARCRPIRSFGQREFAINTKRIYTDGKERRSGFRRVLLADGKETT